MLSLGFYRMAGLQQHPVRQDEEVVAVGCLAQVELLRDAEALGC